MNSEALPKRRNMYFGNKCACKLALYVLESFVSLRMLEVTRSGHCNVLWQKACTRWEAEASSCNVFKTPTPRAPSSSQNIFSYFFRRLAPFPTVSLEKASLFHLPKLQQTTCGLHEIKTYRLLHTANSLEKHTELDFSGVFSSGTLLQASLLWSWAPALQSGS